MMNFYWKQFKIKLELPIKQRSYNFNKKDLKTRKVTKTILK